MLATAAIGAPIAQGCAAQFDPPSKLNSLRVLAVVPNNPYIDLPKDPTGAYGPTTVSLEMTYHDGYIDPNDPENVGERAVDVYWIGPCINPPGDYYYACYEQFAEIFAALGSLDDGGTGGMGGEGGGGLPDALEELLETGKVGKGTQFSFEVDAEITARPKPPDAPKYGIAYVFFLACAGTIRVVADSSEGRAGSFPVGCFDRNTGARLGAESFVPGYTQLYWFDVDDEGNKITNANPEILDLTLDGASITAATRVKPCSVSEEDRRTPGCGKEDPFSVCDPVELKVVVDPKKVAELDHNSQDGLKEAVWVDYFATSGDFEASVKLVSDPEKGFNTDLGSEWIAPSKSSLVTLYAVVHDARGGQAVISRELLVTNEAAPPTTGVGGSGGTGGDGPGGGGAGGGGTGGSQPGGGGSGP